MPNEKDLQQLWQNQINTYPLMPLEDIVKMSGKFQKNIRNRNFREILVGFILAPFFVYKMFFAQSLWNLLMSIEITISIVYICIHLYLWGRNNPPPDSAATTQDFLSHLKKQIQKQIHLLSNVRYWYVLPLFLGIAGKSLERIWLRWDFQNPPWFEILYFLSLPLIAYGCIWLNEVKGVSSLKKELEKLNQI